MKTFALTLVLLTVLMAGLSAQTPTEDLDLQPVQLIIPARFESIYGGPHTVYLPRGFRMVVVRAGLAHPRFLAWDARGVLHVVDRGPNVVYALPLNAQGFADTATAVSAPIDSIHSLAFHAGDLYVPYPGGVKRLHDGDGDGFYETVIPFIDDIQATGVYNHWTRTILFDELLGKLYLGVGASCNACREARPERAAILRYDPDGGNREIYATGLRNPIGLAIEPRTGALWATNADRDHQGQTTPEEIVTSIRPGGFYGWPLAYGDHVWDDFTTAPEYLGMLPITNQDSEAVRGMLLSDAWLPAHSTPMGIVFYPDGLRTDGSFPASYAGSAIVAVHGSGSPDSRAVAVGYNLMRIRRDSLSGKWVAGEFMTGFMTDSVAYKFWGRPCGVALDSSGALYISTDLGIGAVYKIWYSGIDGVPGSDAVAPTMSLRPNVVTADDGGLHVTVNLPAPAHLCFSPHDALGRRVATLPSVMLPAGRSTITLPLPSPLPSGLFWLRAESVNRDGNTWHASERIMINR